MPWQDNLVVAALLLTCAHSGSSARSVGLEVPNDAGAGQTVLLRCTYELHGAQSAQVVWFRNGEEIYR